MCPSCLAGLLGFDDRAAEAIPRDVPTGDAELRAGGRPEPKIQTPPVAPPPPVTPEYFGAARHPAAGNPRSGEPQPQAGTMPVGNERVRKPSGKGLTVRTFSGAVHGQPLNVLLDVPGHLVTAEIARGGMGIVYRATQLEPRREVALKMLLSSQVGIQLLRDHFLLEARAIARLDHPNILPIYHLGEHEGIPFFTMKLATHGSLHQRRARYRNQWSLIAEHVAILADAVSYAHQHGVLHRDLKPGNVLFDESNRPYVTDFGLARVIENGGPAVSEGTHLVGTPRYMAPEVIEGGADAATTGSDVYALGLIFYELMAQRGPYEAANEHEHMRRVLNEPIPRASTFIPGIPVDLELLCLRCLEHDRQQRLNSAAVLRDELRLWIAGKPLHLRQLGWWDRCRVWARRHQLLTVSAIVGFFASIVVAVVAVASVLEWFRFKQEHLQSQASNHENLMASRVGEARRLRSDGRLGQRDLILNSLREAGVAVSTPLLRSEAVWQLTTPNIGEESARYSIGMNVETAVVTPDLDLLAMASPAGELRVWRRSTAKVLWQQQLSLARPPTVLQFSPGSQWLAIGMETNAVALVESTSGNKLRTIAGSWVGFSPDDRDFVTWQAPELRRVGIRSGELQGTVQVPPEPLGLTAIPWLRQGLGESGFIVPRPHELDLVAPSGEVLHRLPWSGDPPTAVAWSDHRVVAGDSSGVLRVWLLPELTPRVLVGHSGPVRRLLLEPGGHRMWSTAARGDSRWWDLQSGTLLGKSPGWQPLRISGTGEQIIAISDDVLSVVPTIREMGRRQLDVPSLAPVRFIDFAPGDLRMLTVQAENLTVWDVATGRPLASVACRGGETAHYSGSGTRLALIESGQVRWLQVVTAPNGIVLKEYQPPLNLGTGRRAGAQSTSRRGFVTLIDGHGDLLSLDVERGEVTKIQANLRPDLFVAMDDRAQTLGLSGPAYGIAAFARPSGRRLFNRPEHWGPLVPSPDGQSYLQPGAGEHRLLEIATGRVKWASVSEPGVAGNGLGAWPADAGYLLAAAGDEIIRLLDPEAGYGIFDLSLPASVSSLTASMDGKQIAAGTANGTVTIWNLPAIESALRGAGIGLQHTPLTSR